MRSKLKEKDLPRIQLSDPVSLYFGLAKGQVRAAGNALRRRTGRNDFFLSRGVLLHKGFCGKALIPVPSTGAILVCLFPTLKPSQTRGSMVSSVWGLVWGGRSVMTTTKGGRGSLRLGSL